MTKLHEVLLFAYHEALYIDSQREISRIQTFHQGFIMSLIRDVSVYGYL